MKTIFVLITLLISQSSFAFVNFAQETVVSSCRISNDVSRAIDHFHRVAHSPNEQVQIKKSLIEIRAAFAYQVTEVLNRPENRDVKLALKELSNTIKRETALESTEYGKNIKVFDAANASQGLFLKLRKILAHKTITPPVFGSHSAEVKAMKLREPDGLDSYSSLYQDGRLNLPLSFEHYNEDRVGGAFQYWFELGIEFDQYGDLTIVDKGATTAIAMAGLCTQEARRQNSNRYYTDYTQAKEGKCRSSVAGQTAIILDKQKVEQEGLQVAINPNIPLEQNFNPQYVASNCNSKELRREQVSLGQYEQLARRPSYNSKRGTFQQASLERPNYTYGLD